MYKQKAKIKQNKILKGNRGITLMALVITIIVLLILAAISIATLTGRNGLTTKANTARMLTVHQHLYEELKLKEVEYVRENQLGKYDDNLISYFLKNGYIEEMDGIEGYIINVPTLTGSKLELGNGTDGKKDVYKLEEIGEGNTTEKEYNIMYYGESEEDDYKLGTLTDGDEPTISEENNKELTINVYGEDHLLLSGATISIYKDAECTDALIKNIEINEGTYVYTPAPPKGTYYVVIDEVPAGYDQIEGGMKVFTIGDEENPIWEIEFGTGSVLPESGPSRYEVHYVIELNGDGLDRLDPNESFILNFSTSKYTEDTNFNVQLFSVAEIAENPEYACSYENYNYTSDFEELEGTNIFSNSSAEREEILTRLISISNNCYPDYEVNFSGEETAREELWTGIYFMLVSVNGKCEPNLCSIVCPQEIDMGEDMYFYDLNIIFVDKEEE